ncbi:adenylyl-sulfate kinase [Thermoleophilum album]|uniref:Adenylyl-sulfate kinase n=1 Tax=Thermoleophilum album TaxID=29539 RepID=A0A1H6FL32_THEAL|nr:adenylyl-sulfate kinase [Thermoleophilum album]SEH11587.1 adenylyl-sulfate kinase [Thermoleophilum album]
MATAAERSPNVVWQRTHVDRAARAARGWCGAVVWLTGLPSSGKSTIAARVEELLVAKGRPAYLLDGDNLRHGLCGDLGFSAADRSENIRRAAHVAALLADAGLVALVALVSPFRADRERARAIAAKAAIPFAEVYVATPPEECERRDPKGLWRRARNGEIQGFTGVDDPYEPPTEPDLVLTPEFAAFEAAQRVLELIERISPTAGPAHAGS